MSVDIKHTYIGDLVITLHPPTGTGVSPIVLQNRSGGARDNLKKTFDTTSTPELSGFRTKNCAGLWKLEVQDAAGRDSGTLTSFAIGLILTHPSRSA